MDIDLLKKESKSNHTFYLADSIKLAIIERSADLNISQNDYIAALVRQDVLKTEQLRKKK